MSRPAIDHDQLRSVPLLDGFDDRQLDAIVGLFERVKPTEGPLFGAGDHAEEFYVLTKGQVELDADDDEIYTLHPLAVIGELGALTGRRRNSTAKFTADSELWRVPVTRLLELFEASPDIGLGFQQNLMHIVAEKIARDQTRLQDMRSNIVRTQKAMKEMRELVLESADTEISAPLHDTIEQLIQRNRRVNYRVAPPASLVSLLRFDQGVAAQVVEISRTHLSFRNPPGAEASADERIVAVLSLSGPEIPVSGRILRVINGRVDVALDPMLDEYIAVLEGYLTRVQMLDFLV